MPSAPPSRRARERSKPTTKKIAGAWWREQGTALAGALFATVDIIRRAQQRQREEDRHHMRLYGNLNVAGSGWVSNPGGYFRGTDGRMRYNLVASAVDTARSIIAQQKPRPQYITEAGGWDLQRQARLRTQVLEGQLHDLGMYEMGPEIQRDGGVVGSGFVFGYIDEDGNPALERCF